MAQTKNPIDSEQDQQEQTPVRVLHVQVAGAPTQETLSEVAAVFNEALKSGKSDAIVTGASVTTSIEYAVPGTSGIEAVIVRPAMTPVEATAIAYQARNAFHDSRVHWNDLDTKIRESYVERGLKLLNSGFAQEDGTVQSEQDSVFEEVLRSLVPYLILPSMSLQVDVWTGETNLHSASAWAKVPFSGLRPQLIFRMPEQYPGQTFVSHTGARVSYTNTSAHYVIDSSEAVVSGSKQIDDSDITKGFTLTWKIKEQEPEQVKAVSPETEAQIQAAVEAGNIDFSQADDTILTDEQDPTVVTDVQYTSVTDEAAEDALQDAPQEVKGQE